MSKSMTDWEKEFEANQKAKEERILLSERLIIESAHQFNMLRDLNYGVEAPAKMIAENAVTFYQELYPYIGRETTGVNKLSKKNAEDLAKNIYSSLLNSSKIEIHLDKEDNTLLGITDDNNKLIFLLY